MREAHRSSQWELFMSTKSVPLAVIVALSSTVAFAQTSTPPAPSPAPQATPAPQTPPPSTTAPQRSANGQPSWYSHQANEVRASKLIGSRVLNTANETVGDINEIILDKDGKVAAVVVGVGGFLGLGEREVAVNFNSIRMSRDNNNNLTLTMNATKDSLKAAPAWNWSDATRK
jgi:sporulation protein YlmC with PRC-barrel domain